MHGSLVKNRGLYRLRFRGESEIQGLRFAAGDRDVLGLRAVGFLPGGDRIFSWRKIGEAEGTVFAGDREVVGLQDGEIPLHPGMNVALYGNELFVFVGVRESRNTGRLDAVPLAVDFSERMNVVGKRIAIGNSDVLTSMHGQHVGGVVAVVLVKEYRTNRCGGGVRRPRGNVDDHILEGVARAGKDGFRQERIFGVNLQALRFLGHIERLRLGWYALEHNFAGDRGASRGGGEKSRRAEDKNGAEKKWCQSHPW